MTDSLHAITTPGDPSLPALVLLHGRGSDERDLLPIGRMLHPTMPVLSVRAPFDAAPWGYGPGYAWYRYIGDTTPEPTSFAQGQEALEEFLGSLPARYGLHHGFILGGFSQGGTSALGFQLRHPGAAAGIMVLSGFLANHPTVLATAATVGTTPIFWGHGTADPAIDFAYATAGWKTLNEVGANLETHRYERMGHTISADEVADVKLWLEMKSRATGQI